MKETLMGNNQRVTALLPLRHNSERVKGKNYRSFGDGRALFEHVLGSLIECQSIDRIVINTDSEVVKSICKQNYPNVIIHDRPEHLLDGNVPMNDIISDDLLRTDGEFFLQTHSTNPLVNSRRFEEAIQCFFSNKSMYDSLFSVTKLQVRLWDSLSRPLNHNQNILLRTQDLPPIYEENSCFYIFNRQTFEKTNMRIGSRPYLFELDKIEAVDIDIEDDFSIAEKIFELREK